MPADRPARIRMFHGPEIDADVVVVRCGEGGWRIIGRQIAGRGRVVPEDAPYVLGASRLIELYCSETDLGRARLRHLSAPLREFIGAEARPNPHLDVQDVDDVPLDVDGYI